MSRTTPNLVITGGAGLVGQNLVVALKAAGFGQITVLDKSAANLGILKKLHSDVIACEADLSVAGDWEQLLAPADIAVFLHAQIGGLQADEFQANNVQATELCLGSLADNPACYIVHVSSSAVNSMADDLYTRSKSRQEQLVLAAPNPTMVLRPTLMFGWFDRKHLGWLSRFMQRFPVFPIPGSGHYLRQPLFVADFCNVIVSCAMQRKTGAPVSITGKEKLSYLDIILTIKKILAYKTWVVCVPCRLFYVLLWVYALFDRNPAFTVHQLKALVSDELFEDVDWESQFDVQCTPLDEALSLTFTHPVYSKVVLEF